MYNNSKKLLAILLVLVMAFATLALVACDDEETFVNPSMPDSGEVTSNGGIAVGYGDYIYYVNGVAIAYSEDNGYTGEAKYGDIVRILVSDLEYAMEITEEEAEDAEAEDYDTYLADYVREHVEVVVPYFYYSGNTTDLTVTGIYIFGERLYFTTPNGELTTNGDSQADQLILCSVKLDGTDMVEHYVITDNSVVLHLAEVESKVYATFSLLNDDTEEYELTTVDVAAGTATVVADNVSTFTVNGDSVYYTTEDGSLAVATAGVEKVLVENEDSDFVTYTTVCITDGNVYYTIADSTNAVSSTPLYMVSATTASTKVLDATSSYTFLGYGAGVVMTSTIFDSDVSAYQLYITSGDIKNENYEYIIEKNTNSGSITLVSIVDDVLTYTIDSLNYTVDLTDINEDGTYNIECIGTSITAGTTWAWYGADTVGKFVFVQDDYADLQIYTQEYDEDDDSWTTSYILFTLVPEETEDEDDE